MPNLKEVKGRIKSVTSTQQITKAMKMVAAAKLRRAQDRILLMRPYSEKMSQILQNVNSQMEGDEGASIYSEERELENLLLIPIASDRGLCGAFNSNIFKAAVRLIETEYSGLGKSSVYVMPIGRRTYDYFRKRDFQVVDGYWEIYGDLSFDNARKAVEYAMSSFEIAQYDRVILIYNEFKNVATQVLRIEQLLPLSAAEEEVSPQPFGELDYIFEPDKEYITLELIPKSLKIQYYKALLESNASENGARMTAMDKATENADELLRDLTLMYNRTRQAAITKEILEIVAGAEALA